ncbi:DNA-binding transcriptional LysR family regulator [Rhizobium sp. ERR 922]|uniref:LysR family transcriptional regulator n=1 Tax=unclassified Rhizobium TaxID=2613769 RepID=UPI00119D160D|nr:MULTISPECIES: LysR family transcriptional regulator [unclassified Rhizobium]TWB46367.1 DNA-binding transcriptional LysR family regulator [Rhizobium sp. ERR 922]TWB88734.1 DNA-binding transcriptional LysR family regulator [Rhizobium sp. ERR 942]
MNEKPTFAELGAFLAVARHRNFRKAADELDIAPSTLSHFIRRLEGRLETRLLHRSTRSVSLTAAGEALASRLSPLIHDLDEALVEASNSRNSPRGVLRVLASDVVATLLMDDVVPTFLSEYPHVQLELVANSAFVDIVAEGFDAAFRLGDDIPKDMIALKFGATSRMKVVGSPAYLKGRHLPASPGELDLLDCVRSRPATGVPYRWEFERGGEKISVEPKGPFTVNRSELALRAAIRGLGVSCLPERLCRTHLETGALVSLLDDWSSSYDGLCLYYPGHRLVPPALRAFIDVVKRSELA